MKICFIAGKCIPIHARSLEERALGGTETGVIRVAAALAERGHEVTVFTSHRNPPQDESSRRSLQYRFVNEVSSAPSDSICIAVQDWWPVFLKLPFRKRLFWTGDAGDQYLTFGIGDKRIQAKIDLMLCVSQWQADHLCEVSGFPRVKTHVVRNGVHLDWFSGDETRASKRLIYSSAPYRGLGLAPPILELLRKRHPDVELEVFAGLDVYAREGSFEGPEKRQFEQLSRVLSEIPGVHLRGNILQAQLAREFMKSRLLFYPNTFPETSCITALESMAAGTPVVTSNFAALPETVDNAGILVPSTPGSLEYTKGFADSCAELLENEAKWLELSRRSRAKVFKEYSWEVVTNRFEEAFTQLGLS